jgi:hypothetical protein
MGDEDAAQAIDTNLEGLQLAMEGLPRFVGLEAGVDQGEAITVTEQVDVDMPQLKGHGQLEAEDARRDFH